VAEGTIANAAVRTMNGTPVTLVAAPGVGLYLEPVRCDWFLDYTAPAFDAAGAGDTLNVVYHGATDALVDPVAGDTIGAAAADYHVTVARAPEFLPVANTALDAYIATGEWFGAAGGSVLKYRLAYRVLPLLT
jgi:hypothetical protein